jgi:hypothetical protein
LVALVLFVAVDLGLGPALGDCVAPFFAMAAAGGDNGLVEDVQRQLCDAPKLFFGCVAIER